MVDCNMNEIETLDLKGQNATIGNITALQKGNKFYVILDTAHAIAAKYTFSNVSFHQASTKGDLETTSFFSI